MPQAWDERHDTGFTGTSTVPMPNQLARHMAAVKPDTPEIDTTLVDFRPNRAIVTLSAPPWGPTRPLWSDQKGFTITRITMPIISTVGTSFIQR